MTDKEYTELIGLIPYTKKNTLKDYARHSEKRDKQIKKKGLLSGNTIEDKQFRQIVLKERKLRKMIKMELAKRKRLKVPF